MSNMLQDCEVLPVNRSVKVTFVDRSHFKKLQGVHFKLEDFVTTVVKGRDSKAMSVMSQAYLAELNTRLSDLVLGAGCYFNAPSLTSKELEYTRDAVWSHLTGIDCYSLSEAPVLCYDTIPVDANNLLVVVGNGFLNHLAGNKDNYREFVLACVRCMDRFNCDVSQLNQLYLQLQLSGAPYELLRCRIQ